MHLEFYKLSNRSKVIKCLGHKIGYDGNSKQVGIMAPNKEVMKEVVDILLKAFEINQVYDESKTVKITVIKRRK